MPRRQRLATFYCSHADCPKRWLNFRAPPSPKAATCPACGREATLLARVRHGGGHGYVLKDFPEHFNWSMGCIVKSRKHHEQLQKERGLQDWQPVKESPQLSKLRRMGYL